MALSKTVNTLKVLDELDEFRRNNRKYDYEIRLAQAIIAGIAGEKSREKWTALLLEDKSSKYYKYGNEELEIKEVN